MKTFLILIATCFIGATSPSNEIANEELQNCDSELTVEKNRTFKSADKDGVSFSLHLQNKSLKAQTYVISAKNISESCANNKNYADPNVQLEPYIVLPYDKAPNNTDDSSAEIEIQPGQSIDFHVKIKVPNNTPVYRWGCIEVEASSTDCSSRTPKAILSVYIPNPSEG